MSVQNTPSAPRPRRPDEQIQRAAAAAAAGAAAAPAAAQAATAAAQAAAAAAARSVLPAAATTFTNAVERTADGGVKVDLHQAAVAAREARAATRSQSASQAAPVTQAPAGTPVTNLGGLQIRGLDLNSIQEGTFKMSIPMREGTFMMPTSYEDAEIEVPRGTKAEITVKVGKGPDGKPCITEAKLNFNHELKVLNPASSLQPTGGTFGGAIDTVQDWLGDITLKGLTMGRDGQMKVNGTVDKPWPMSDTKLQDEIGPNTFPKFKTDIESLVAGEAVARPADAAKIPGKSVGLDEMLKGLGAMTRLGTYTIDLKSGPSKLTADGNGIHLSTDTAPVKVHLEGKFEVDRNGAMTLNIDKNALPEVMSGAGNLDVTGQLRVTTDNKGKLKGTGDVAFTGNINGVSGVVNPADNISVPVEIRGANNVVAGSTKIELDGDKVKLSNGKAKVSVNTRVPEGTRIDIAGTGVTLKEGQVKTDAGLNFSYDGNSVNVSDGKINTKITAADADVSYNGVKVRVDGKTEIQVQGENIALNSTTMNPSANGTITMRAEPKAGVGVLPPLTADAKFKLNPDGTMALTPGKDSVTEFLTPFTSIRGRPDNLVDPKSPPAGPVGSQAMKDRITQLTGAPVRENNRAELLIDGLASQQKRLELINNAKDSICLQTLIFQDDKTGTETANALAEAAKRGVKVRVIVDSLGNVEGLKDLTEGKKVYETMRNAGVELVLHNDPKDSGLKDLVEELKRNPQLANIKSMNDLTNPAVAVPLFRRLAEVAQGKVAGASPATQAKITDALGKLMGGTGADGLTVNANEIAKLAMGDTIRMGEILAAVKQTAELNHRWHEKYLIADGKQTVMGGMNIADEYLRGGSGEKVDVMGHQKTAWRDTDMYLAGPAAADSYNSFARNWKTSTGQDIPPAPPAESLAISAAQGGGTQVQILQHRPRQDGDHNTENFMIENIKALKAGETCYIGNAYFLPTGALEGYKQALMDAAKRGVDVRIVTNSAATNDMPQMNQAAIPAYREMLAAGVRIFERTGDRTMHQKVAVFGGNTVAVGSWNADNRSASLNSEAMAVAYGEQMGRQANEMVLRDMDASVAREVKLDEIKALPMQQELENAGISLFRDLM